MISNVPSNELNEQQVGNATVRLVIPQRILDEVRSGADSILQVPIATVTLQYPSSANFSDNGESAPTSAVSRIGEVPHNESYRGKTDAELIEPLIDNNNAARAEVYRRYECQVKNVVYIKTKNITLADDIAQDVWFEFFATFNKRFDATKSGGSFWKPLSALIGWKVSDHLRKRSRRVKVVGGEESAGEYTPDIGGVIPGKVNTREENRLLLLQAVRNLASNRPKHFVWIRERLLGKANKDLARRYGLTEQQVANKIHAAKECLRKELKSCKVHDDSEQLVEWANQVLPELQGDCSAVRYFYQSLDDAATQAWHNEVLPGQTNNRFDLPADTSDFSVSYKTILSMDSTFKSGGLENYSYSELVVLAQQGDKNALGILLEQHKGLVYGIGMRRFKRPRLAENLVQDVSVMVIRKLSQLREPKAFSGWLKTIAARVAINTAQRANNSLLTDSEILGATLDSEVDTPDMILQGAERKAAVQEALPKLSEMDEATLRAFYFDGKSLLQMAEEFEAPMGTIKRRLHVARKRLAKALEGIIE